MDNAVVSGKVLAVRGVGRSSTGCVSSVLSGTGSCLSTAFGGSSVGSLCRSIRRLGGIYARLSVSTAVSG